MYTVDKKSALIINKIISVVISLLTVISFTIFLQTPAQAQGGVSKVLPANEVLSNVTHDTLMLGMQAEKHATYDHNRASYIYQALFYGLKSLSDNSRFFSEKLCVVTEGGVIIKSTMCAVMLGNFDPGSLVLDTSGDYVLTADGRIVASWRFTRPLDLPRALAAAQCVVKSAKPVQSGSIITSIAIVDNGKCKLGNWVFSYKGKSGVSGEVVLDKVGKGLYGDNLRVAGHFLIPKSSTVTVTFYPDGYFKINMIVFKVK